MSADHPDQFSHVVSSKECICKVWEESILPTIL